MSTAESQLKLDRWSKFTPATGVNSVTESVRIDPFPHRDLKAPLPITMGPGQDVEESTAISMAADEFLDVVRLPPHLHTAYTSSSQFADAVHAHLARIHRLLTEPSATELRLTPGDVTLGVQAPRAVELKFQAPVAVEAVGSVCQRTTPSDPVQLDVVLDLPPTLFQNKDYLDRRYFARRALYLGHARSLLSPWYNVTILLAPSSTLLPCLSLQRRQDEPHLWQINGRPLDSIRLLTRVTPELFVARRLAPQRNALRSPNATIATPFYNQVMLHEMYRHEHVRWLREWHELTPSLASASLLARRWLAQRQVDLGGFVIDVLVAYLHECGRIVAAMTPWQMFRALLLFFTEVDLTKGVAIIEIDEFPLTAFTTLFPVTFVASCGRCNFFYTLPLYTYGRLRHEAHVALQPHTTFAQLFLDDCLPSIKFDVHLYVTVPREQIGSHRDPIADRSPLINVAARAYDLLIRAFTDRVTFLDIVAINHDTSTIRIGLLLNDAEASRILDRGPKPDDVAACTDFRQFWGDLSSLRRFRDGSMAEAVVWPEPSPDRHYSSVIADIAQCILQRHLQVSCRAVLAGTLDLAANLPQMSTDAISAAYRQLCGHLRSLSELPLQICNVTSACPSLRRCRPFHTGPIIDETFPDNDPMVYRDLIPVVVQFESSARWPEDLTAIARIKTAILIRMTALLREQTQMAATAFPMWVVVWCERIAFRIEIYHTREMVIRKAERDFASLTKTMNPTKNTVELVAMERDLVHRPLIATELQSLCQRFVMMSPTVCLVKRWISGHLIADLFDEESIELLVAYVFLHPAPFSTPASSLSAFCQILLLICSYDWENRVLIVDLHGDLTNEQRSEMQNRFKDGNGAGSMRIASFRDVSSSLWKSPPPEALPRVKAVARSALDHIRSVIDSQPSDLRAMKTAFKAPLSRYDIFIKLNPKYVPYCQHALFPVKAPTNATQRKFKPAVPSSDAIRAWIQSCSAGVNPVQKLVECLRSAFSGVATFLFDPLGSDLVVGKLLRGSSQKRRLKFGKTNLNYMRPVGDDKVDVNMDQIMYDIRRIGDGIITNIFFDVNQYKKSL